MKRKESISIAVDEGNSAYKRGVIAGRKEVVNWITANGGSLDGHYKQWHNQLEQWGVFKGVDYGL